MERNNFTKEERILKRSDFVYLNNSGNRLYDRYFVGIFSITKRSGLTRLGITVSKKVGNAVIRNRIKRYIREFFRNNKKAIFGSLDIVIVAKKAAADISTAEAFSSLRYVFEKLSLRIK